MSVVGTHGVASVLTVMSGVREEWGGMALMSVQWVLMGSWRCLSLSESCATGDGLGMSRGKIGDSHLGIKSTILYKTECSETTVQKFTGVA